MDETPESKARRDEWFGDLLSECDSFLSAAILNDGTSKSTRANHIYFAIYKLSFFILRLFFMDSNKIVNIEIALLFSLRCLAKFRLRPMSFARPV